MEMRILKQNSVVINDINFSIEILTISNYQTNILAFVIHNLCFFFSYIFEAVLLLKSS